MPSFEQVAETLKTAFGKDYELARAGPVRWLIKADGERVLQQRFDSFRGGGTCWVPVFEMQEDGALKGAQS